MNTFFDGLLALILLFVADKKNYNKIGNKGAILRTNALNWNLSALISCLLEKLGLSKGTNFVRRREYWVLSAQSACPCFKALFSSLVLHALSCFHLLVEWLNDLKVYISINYETSGSRSFLFLCFSYPIITLSRVSYCVSLECFTHFMLTFYLNLWF